MKQRKLTGLSSFGLLVGAYFVTWADLFFPLGPAEAFSGQWFCVSAVKNILRVLIVLILGRLFRFESVPSFRSLFPKDPGTRRSRLFPDAMDMLNGLVIAGAAFGVVLACSLVSLLFHYTNPVLRAMSGVRLTPEIFLGITFLSFSVGYAEELFFRCFAEESFRNIGLSPFWAMGASSLLFGVSHGAQGAGGMVIAALLGLVFSLFRKKGRSLHAIALGHALYDFFIMLLAFNL